MLTVTHEPAVSESIRAAQIETLPSDLEISRRVLQIRSKWSLSERVRRRREAEQRFNDLVDSLMGPAA
jgi:hypothetical protein